MALAMVLGVLLPGTVLAAESPPPAEPITWGVAPSTASGPDGRGAFEYLVERGTVIEDYVGISNFTNQDLALSIYASDAFTTEAGGFDLLPGSSEPVDVGAWVEFAARTVTVPARSRLDVPFRITVPDTATPGDHPGGIVASLQTSTEAPNGSQLTVDRRVGSRIYLRVKGELRLSLAIENLIGEYAPVINPFAGGTISLRYTVRNTGNVRATGKQTASLVGPFGLAHRAIAGTELPEILPGQSVERSMSLEDVAPLGLMTVDLSIEPIVPGTVGIVLRTTPANASTVVWAIPWVQVGLIVFAALWLVRRRRLRRQAVTNMEPDELEQQTATDSQLDVATDQHARGKDA